MTKKKDYLDPKKREQKRNLPRQLQLDNVSINDVKNTNRIDKWPDLDLANKPWTVSQITEGMQQKDKKKGWSTLHWLTHPQRKQNEAGKSSEKNNRYDPTKHNNHIYQSPGRIWHKVSF